MLVKSIYEQVKEVTGKCDEAINFQAISRAIELLSNEGLFDPLIGYLDFTNSGSNIVTLPRVVKTVLRVNINSEPTFFRNRLFEFTLNTAGTVTGDEDGLTWMDKGYSPIQKESLLPGILRYKCENSADIGKKITIHGYDSTAREISETIAAGTSPVLGSLTFARITSVNKESTVGVCLLYCNGTTNIIAQYYPDETDPSYRVIKLSKAAASVRVMFRRDVYEVTSQEDLIPLHSKMAVIHATKAVRYFASDEYDKGDAALARAVDFIKKEQASRDEQDAMAAALETPSAINTGINVRDAIVVADVYDSACEIFGNLGRVKILDKITQAIEVLRNKAHWDAGTGVVDIYTEDQSTLINHLSGKGSGYYVLPRFVESVISLNFCGSPLIPRNRWFEFHMNGDGETNRSHHNTWDDAGETVVLRRLLIVDDPDESNRRLIPVQVLALCDNSQDADKKIKIYGYERLADGKEVEVWRNGERGYLCPCVVERSAEHLVDSPHFVRFDRITKEASAGFIRLVSATGEWSPFVPGVAQINPVGGYELIPPGPVTFAYMPWDTVPTNAATFPPFYYFQTLYKAHQSAEGDDDEPFVRISILKAVDPLNPPQFPPVVPNGVSPYSTYIPDGFEQVGLLHLNASGGGDTFDISAADIGTVDIDDGVNAFSTDVTNIPLGRTYFKARNYTPEILAKPEIDTYAEGMLLGYWYPDEIEPNYRAIQVPSDKERRIRILYRKRFLKLTSIFEPIPLRSRLAIENMMRAIKAMATDPAGSQAFEQLAVSYLADERINSTPSDQGSLQFDSASMPGFTGNIQ